MASKRRYFGTDGIRGTVGVLPITEAFLTLLGQALGYWLCQEGHSKVLIGRDTRESGIVLENALIAGLIQQGIEIVSIGVATTPMVAYLTKAWGAHLGVVISASHNPYTDNGLKFFSQEGTKLNDAFELAIELLLAHPSQNIDCKQSGQVLTRPEANATYVDFCLSLFPQLSLKDFKIVLDAAEGAGSVIGPMVLKRFGAEVITLHCSPNGRNINENCGATNPKRLAQSVLEHKADIGIAFDGDADRLIMVDHQGEIVDGDELLWILSAHYHRQNRLLGHGVVGTLMTNMGFVKAIEPLGIEFERAAVGDRFVMEALTNKGWVLGGETSGHLLCLDKTSTGDALIAALNVLEALIQQAQMLNQAKHGMQKWPQVLKNVKMTRDAWNERLPVMQEAIRALELRFVGQVRVVVRPSGTEPLVRVMVEAADLAIALEGVDDLVKKLTGAL